MLCSSGISLGNAFSNYSFFFFLNSKDFYTPVSVLLRFRRGGEEGEVEKENQHSPTLISFRKEFASRRFLEM